MFLTKLNAKSLKYMEEDIQHNLTTFMFRVTPCI